MQNVECGAWHLWVLDVCLFSGTDYEDPVKSLCKEWSPTQETELMPRKQNMTWGHRVESCSDFHLFYIGKNLYSDGFWKNIL